MVHILLGLVLFVLGWWGIMENWHLFLDLVWVIVPLLLLLFGVLSIVAGIGHAGRHVQMDALDINPEPKKD
jgi:hypothetical protein